MAAVRAKRRHRNDIDVTSSGSESSDSDFTLTSESSSTDESDSSSGPTVQKKRATDVAQGQAAVVWKQRDCFPRRFGFSGNAGITVDELGNFSSPLDIFVKFIPEELFCHIADQTNKYAADNRTANLDSHSRDWFNTTPDEIKALVSLVVLMGITPKPNIQAYWSSDPMGETPFFASTMPRDRFLQLLSNLHFNNNEDDDGTDRLFKLRPVMDTVVENFKTVYIPSQTVCTDESLWKFNGRLKWKQYNPAKRDQFGIKVYKTCQSTGVAAGYTWNLKIDTGEDQGDIPASTRTVLELNEDLLDHGYNIFLDNRFSSPDLFLRLQDRRTNACGTVRWKQMPPDLENVKLKSGEIAFRSSDKGLLALLWKDKKDVKMLSTMHSAAMEDTDRTDKDGNPIQKPSCVLDYNRGKGGVDLSDQLASSHRSVRKAVKWYKKLFFYLVDLCLVNSFIVYQVLGQNIQYLDFRMALIKEILHTVSVPVYSKRSCPHTLPSPSRLTGRHFPVTLPPTTMTANPCRRCVVCKYYGQRRETRYACDTCNLPLCVHPCFKIYHTERYY